MDDFHQQLLSLGFVLSQQDRRGVLQFARQPNRFLTEWVHDDGEEALFTWEFELGAYCTEAGWQLGTGDPSVQILFPQYDARIARDIDAVAIEVSRLEQQLNGLDLADPAL